MATDYDALFDQAGREYNVDPRLLKTVFQVESSQNPNTPDSNQGAKGGMQFLLPTAIQQGMTNPYDMTQAIPAAAQYLAKGLQLTGTPEGALAFYHSGSANPAAWGPKTQQYIARGESAYPSMKLTVQEAAQPMASETKGATFQDPEANAIFQGLLSRGGAGQTTPPVVSGPPTAPAPTGGAAFADPEANAIFQGLVSRTAPAPTPTVAVPPATSSTPAPYMMSDNVPLAPNTGSSLPMGVMRGAIDTTAGWWNPLIGMIDRKLGLPEGTAQIPQNKLLAEQEAAQYAGQPGYGMGKFVGSTGATLAPLMPAVRAAGAAAGLIPGVADYLAGSRILAPAATAAAYGAGAGAMTNPQNPGTGAAFGAALGGVTGGALGAGGALLSRLAGTGENSAAARVENQLIKSAGSGQTQPSPYQPIPGVEPTLAQSTGNPGIALVEKQLRQNPQTAQQFIEQDVRNNAVRLNEYSKFSGNEGGLAGLNAARDAQAASDLQAAFGNKQPVTPVNALGKIQDILQSPDVKRPAITNAIGSVFKQLQDKAGNLETDPEMLYGVRQHITDMLSPLARGTDADARLAASRLMDVKAALDKDIESGAPGYQSYLTNYAANSQQIDGQQYLQQLLPKLTDANGQFQLNKVNSALNSIQKARDAGGVQVEKSLSPDQMDMLQRLKESLQEDANKNLGKASGSDTAQNFTTQGQMGMNPVAHSLLEAVSPRLGAVVRLGSNIANATRPDITQALANRLLQGDVGVGANPLVAAPRSMSPLQGVMSGVVLPPVENNLIQRRLPLMP